MRKSTEEPVHADASACELLNAGGDGDGVNGVDGRGVVFVMNTACDVDYNKLICVCADMPLFIVVPAGMVCIFCPIVGYILYVRSRRDMLRQRNENLSVHLNSSDDTLQKPLELVPTAYPVAVAQHITDTNEKCKMPEASAEPLAMSTAV